MGALAIQGSPTARHFSRGWAENVRRNDIGAVRRSTLPVSVDGDDLFLRGGRPACREPRGGGEPTVAIRSEQEHREGKVDVRSITLMTHDPESIADAEQIFLARKLREAREVEELLTDAGINYSVEVEAYARSPPSTSRAPRLPSAGSVCVRRDSREV